MIEIMIKVVGIIVHLMDIAVLHQVDGGVTTVITSTSTTTMENFLSLYY